MSKQLDFTEKEKDDISLATKILAEILLRKLDEGVDRPTIEGSITMKGEGKEVVFEVTAQKSTPP